MSRKSLCSGSSFSHSRTHAEAELLQSLLQTDEECYPWNPMESGSEAYLAELEQEFVLDDWSDQEIAVRSQTFFNQLDRLWVRNTLFEHFAHRVPQALLNTIAQQAQQIVSTNLSLAEKLVQCVQEILPHWADDDLQVLARPLAYAMRGNPASADHEATASEAALGVVRPVDWTELSEVEQARLSLAIAHYTLTNLADSTAVSGNH